MKKGNILPNALELTTIRTMTAIGSIAGTLIALVVAAPALVTSITTTAAFESILGTITVPINQRLAFAQETNTSSSTILINETKGNITTTTIPTTIPTLATSGTKEFYVFTSEVANVDEAQLRVPGDTFDITTMVVNKGDNVTVHFYNVDPNKTERHSFTIGAPYNVDLDLAGGGESAVANFTADHEGIFQYYCKYHLPVMTGQLEVVVS
jgi:nitrous oxide reductase